MALSKGRCIILTSLLAILFVVASIVMISALVDREWLWSNIVIKTSMAKDLTNEKVNYIIKALTTATRDTRDIKQEQPPANATTPPPVSVSPAPGVTPVVQPPPAASPQPPPGASPPPPAASPVQAPPPAQQANATASPAPQPSPAVSPVQAPPPGGVNATTSPPVQAPSPQPSPQPSLGASPPPQGVNATASPVPSPQPSPQPSPGVNVTTPTVNITVPVNETQPSVNVTVPGVSENVTAPTVNITVPGVNETQPSVNVTVPEVNVTTPYVSENVTAPTVNVTVPSVTVPEANVTTPTVNVTVPVNETQPSVNVTVPGVGENVTAPGTNETVPGTNETIPSTNVTEPETNVTTPQQPETNATEPTTTSPLQPTCSFTYSNLQQWNQCPDSTCNGTNQSPIDVSQTNAVTFNNYLNAFSTSKNVLFYFPPDNSNIRVLQLQNATSSPIPFTLQKTPQQLGLTTNDQSISLTLHFLVGNNQSSLQDTPVNYYLKEIQIHSPTEHTLNSLQQDVETQMYFTIDPNANVNGSVPQIVAIAVFYQVGEFENPIFGSLVNLGQPDQLQSNASVDGITGQMLGNTLLTNFYYVYNGSLTVPGCTEGVMWIIINNPQYLSVPQLTWVKRAVNQANLTPNAPPFTFVGNNRPIQQNSNPVLIVSAQPFGNSFSR